jgi:hypothetical protein
MKQTLQFQAFGVWFLFFGKKVKSNSILDSAVGSKSAILRDVWVTDFRFDHKTAIHDQVRAIFAF